MHLYSTNTVGDFTSLTPEKKSTCFAKISNTVIWVERERNTQQLFNPMNKPFLTHSAADALRTLYKLYFIWAMIREAAILQEL